jgi:hypothetical protein
MATMATGMSAREPMEPSGRACAATISSAIHGMQARVAAIRLAVSTVNEPGVDGVLRSQLLETADDQAALLSAELACIGALSRATSDRSGFSVIDLAQALRRAASSMGVAGARIRVVSEGGAAARVRGPRLDAVLPPLLRLLAHGGELTARVQRPADAILVELARDDRASEPSDLVASLVAAIGGSPPAFDRAVSFTLPGPTS